MNCQTCGHPHTQHTTLAGCLSQEGTGYCDCAAFLAPVHVPLQEPPAAIAHDGATYDPGRDAKPLNSQQQAVYTLMLDGKFRTLAEIAQATGYPEASISARLRDLRKPKWGGKDVIRRNRAGRLWEYAVLEPQT